jgi:hypothetical protein
LKRVAAGFAEAEACRPNGFAFFCRIKQREATNRRAYRAGVPFEKGCRGLLRKRKRVAPPKWFRVLLPYQAAGSDKPPQCIM